MSGDILSALNIVHEDLGKYQRWQIVQNLKGYYYELGILHKKVFNENDEFSIGFIANNNSSIRAKKTELIESFEFSGFLEIPKDTFLNSVNWSDISLPKYINTGIKYNIYIIRCLHKSFLFIIGSCIYFSIFYNAFLSHNSLSLKISSRLKFVLYFVLYCI